MSPLDECGGRCEARERAGESAAALVEDAVAAATEWEAASRCACSAAIRGDPARRGDAEAEATVAVAEADADAGATVTEIGAAGAVAAGDAAVAEAALELGAETESTGGDWERRIVAS